MDKTPRGLEVNNPLNIDKNAKNKWQGKVTPSRDRRFETFETMVYGVRAGAVLIINHYDKKNANTIRKLINVWAPKKENPTDAYAETVGKWSGFDPDTVVNFHEYAVLRPVIEAMIRFEQGQQPLTAAQIDKGLAMAGVVNPDRDLKKSKTVGGATVSTIGVGGSAGIDIITQAGDLGPLADYVPTVRWIMLGLIIIGIGICLYARWDDFRKLAR